MDNRAAGNPPSKAAWGCSRSENSRFNCLLASRFDHVKSDQVCLLPDAGHEEFTMLAAVDVEQYAASFVILRTLAIYSNHCGIQELG